MNSVHFGCLDCKMHVDAGYRWAYWQLEDTGVVDKYHPVSAAAVLAASNYWEPGRDAHTEWLYADLFPGVRRFFAEHAAHRLIYGQADELFGDDYESEYLDWLDVGTFCPGFSTRTGVELLGFTRWEQVEQHVSTLATTPWWWWDAAMERKAKDKFESLVASRGD